VAELLSKSLAEEEIAGNLMRRELMSESRTGMTKQPKRGRPGATTSTGE
jgi:hypothetical protein